jgi:hypothetical protein
MKLYSMMMALPLGCIYAAEGTPYLPFYDTTWAGPVQLAKNLNTSSNSSAFASVEATLVMPHLALPKQPRQLVNEYTASFWIGMDGFLSSETARGLWQAGVIMSIWDNGTTKYSGFYEW